MKKLIFTLVMVPFLALGSGVDLTTQELKTIELTEDNSIVLRESVNWSSISRLQYQLLQLSVRLGKKEPIYVVLDTPGGSVSAGEMFIETVRGIPQPVHAIVLFAASMGFQITQALGSRYIVNSGTLMSHRATVGFKGQLDGEIESRLLYYKTTVGSMEVRAANRIGLNVEEYKQKIVNEWWEYGNDAVKTNMADEVVVVKCSDELLKGTIKQRIFSFFGSREFEFSKCPLITAPVSVSKPGRTRYADIYFDLLFFNKRNFIKNYIDTGMFNR